jgi:hypothetical protein
MGELVMEKLVDTPQGDQLRIIQADPRVRITAELVHDIRLGTPWTRLDGNVLTIRDDFGKHFIYRIGDYDPRTATYEMEWPD